MLNQKQIKKNFIFILLLFLLSLFINLPSRLPFNLTKPTVNLAGFNFSPPLKFGLDLAGGALVTYQIDTAQVKTSDLSQALESLKSNIEKRINLFGLTEANVQTSSQGDSHRLIVELPGIDNLDQALALIGQTARLKFMGETPIPPEATDSASFADVFSAPTGLDGSHLLRASTQFNPNNSQPEVKLEFNPEGTQLFAQATEKFLNQRIAIFLDDMPVTFPVVQSVITDGQAVISGSFDTQSARTLAAQLNAGALPLSISLLSQKQIGATLGQDSINKGLTAALVGLFLVFFFMIGNYGLLGLVANLALIIYALISLSLYRLIPITLTFPGIVGFILSVGMAVDSNILIFERFREETRLGRDRAVGLERAFGRAWDSIKDANICTIITALILLNPLNFSFLPSSGLVRGFALTLLLGILIGLFTGVFVSRNLLRIFIKK